MTAAKDSPASATPAATMDALLWRWVDHVNRDGEKGMTRPEWFACVGELELAETVTWYGMATAGRWGHGGLLSGPSKAPVYAGFYWSQVGDEPRVARVSMVVLPLADPARIVAADWNDGYNGYEPAALDGYAVLCGDPFDPLHVDGRDAEADLCEVKRIIAAGDRQGRRVNYAEIVTDPDRGGNALFFPVNEEERDGYEALEEDGTVVCLAFIAYDFAY
ncbi:hypothetical protein ACFV8Z_53665 [Streptomyces sp. NPDC059837]|uniref:hypothetical protein n=1 Tax=unclassified Streptomyces TaxID=2593676 RepID=UPI00224D64FC|nr:MULTISPECIES: hypothetical protein [unclassified Streptomyces]MCX4403682.1 hypothetical protein [Streptomyces sp. NBC_01764]MCX5181363.1 hypothetical protein [Streptomyces sp. NBC_00268]